MDAFINWLMTRVTGDNVLAIGLLIGLSILARQFWHWGLRPRCEENPNDVGVITDHYETLTSTAKENAANIRALASIIGSVDQHVRDIKKDTADLIVAKNTPFQRPGDSGIGKV